MAFQLSPGVNVTEIDLTTIVPAVSTSTGAIAGVFRWGPVNQATLVTNENDLANFFGTPTANNAETWFTAASFLGYGSSLYVVRTANTSDSTLTNGAISAFANSTAAPASNIAQTILNRAYYDNTASFDSAVQYVAKYPGALGSSLRISVCDTASVYASNVSMVNTANQSCNATFTFAIGSNSAVFSQNTSLVDTTANTWVASVITNNLSVGDVITVGNSSVGTQAMKISNIGTIASAALTINFTTPFALATPFVANSATGLSRKWEFASAVSAAPASSYWNTNFGNTTAIDTLHAVVVDAGGLFTGTPNTILEVFPNVSRATDAQSADGASIYYKTVINNTSKYVWWANDRANALSNTAVNIATSTNTTAYNQRFVAGNDGYTETTVPLATLATGYSLFADKQTLPISLVLQGKPIGGTVTVNGQTLNNFQLGNFLIDNIGEVRKDCVVFVTPDQGIVTSNPGAEAVSLVNWATNALHTSTYAVVDSGYKQMYDRYNDVYRYIPTNGDVAGLCARTDVTNNSWWSPAGFNRGQIKNIVKLRWNPNQASRDVLYSNAINPLVSFPGQGTVLYGDKTFTVKPSAFDRINVRRLFIVIEKAIAQAAQYSLFEFNDDFTRAQFRNLITPYLSQVQALRGITDFLVVCDTTNNTSAVINANQFVGDIYIKPNRSINFIQLNFVAVRSGVDFSTVVGRF